MDILRRVRGSTRWSAAATSVVLVVGMMAGLSLGTASPAEALSAPSAPGYWLVASDGGVYQFGTTNFGSLRGRPLNRPIVSSAAAPNGLGYWLVASDGGVFPFGSAGYHGSTGNVRLNQPIVGMAASRDGGGYWLVARDGGIFEFGDAHFYGSTGNVRLNKPIVGMAATPDGGGYWLVASDGGIFQFGDAHFYGSTGNVRLNQPIVGMAATPDGGGYWLVARDGGIFEFGDAQFRGSTGNVRLNRPIVGMAAAGTSGYWMVASDGGLFSFGDARYLGSTGGSPGPAPIVSMSATAHGFPFPPGGTGFDISNYQCSEALPASHTVSIVEVAGAINGFANSCYSREAAWAGVNMSTYIFMDGLPSPAPAESASGPAGVCNGNVNCESYNFGWYWANHWVAYSHSLGINPSYWWLDVELNHWTSNLTSNGFVVVGAMAALRANSVVGGIYSTPYQWGHIVGALGFPGAPLWVPGAGNLTGPGYTATNYCANPAESFAGGVVVLVQYGYGGDFVGAYSGPQSPFDLDYACG